MNLPKRLVHFSIIVFLSLVIVYLITTLYRTFGLSQKESQLDGEIASKQRQEKELQNLVNQRNSDAYVEEEARNKLMMLKNGETLVVIPKDLTRGNSSNSATIATYPSSYPQQWLSLFFGEP